MLMKSSGKDEEHIDSMDIKNIMLMVVLRNSYLDYVEVRDINRD